MAAPWVLPGAEFLHVVDLDGAREGVPANLASLQAILARVPIPCQFGGGVRSQETIRGLLDCGVARVVVGTRALSDPPWFQSVCETFPGRIVLGLDARDGKVATDGWLETSQTAAVDLARRYDPLDLAAIVYTDIRRDGMLSGPNLPALSQLAATITTPLVASGGVHTVEDVAQIAELGVAGCIVGRALYEGTLRLGEAIDAARAHAAE
jgi:phosphoribosylformimino-5-aminoimidazole carboxamide ribotide isomerase